MCIIGCYPKRAGYNFLNRYEDDSPNISEDIKLKVFDISKIIGKNPLIVDNDFKNPYIKDRTQQYIMKLKSTRIPKNYVLQGSLLLYQCPNENWKNMGLHFINYFNDPSYSYFRMLRRFSKGKYKIKLIFAYSKEDNIKSYLFGSDNFSMPHWFISKKLDDFNQESIDKTLKIFNVSNLNQAKKIIESRTKKTPCIFCSEKTLRKVHKFYRNTLPEITWCNDRVK